MFAKRLFYVSASILMLALAYHLGARSATAQAGSQVTGFTLGPRPGAASGARLYALTPNGDVYAQELDGSGQPLRGADLIGNYWTGAGPTSVHRETWGSLKARYRGDSGRE